MTLPALARPDDRVTAWRWPLDLDAYDRDPALTPNERAALARRARFPHRFGHWTPLFHQELGRLARPVTDALDYLEIRHERARARVQCRLAQALYREESTYWAWPEGTWRSLLGTSRRSFNDRASTDRVSRGAFLAVGLVLKCAIVLDCLGKYERVPVAYRLFGHARVEAALDRVMQALVDWGYALPSRPSMRLTLCETFLFVQSPRLDDLTLDHLTRLRVATARHTRLRGGVLRLSRALAGLGVIPAPLNAWAYDESARLTPLTKRRRFCRHGAPWPTAGARRRPWLPRRGRSTTRRCSRSAAGRRRRTATARTPPAGPARWLPRASR